MNGLMGSIQLDCEINDDRTMMCPKFIEEYTRNWKEHTVPEFWQVSKMDSKEPSKRKQKLEHLWTMECFCITISRTGPNTGKDNENNEISL